MKSRNTLRIFLLGLAILGGFLVLQSAKAKPAPGACKEAQDCCKQHQKGDGGMIWENLSHQFFSSL